MVRMENHLGIIEISQEYFSYLVGNAVQSCYGVVGMVRSGARQGLRSIFTRRAHTDDGVHVHSDGDRAHCGGLRHEYLGHFPQHCQ